MINIQSPRLLFFFLFMAYLECVFKQSALSAAPWIICAVRLIGARQTGNLRRYHFPLINLPPRGGQLADTSSFFQSSRHDFAGHSFQFSSSCSIIGALVADYELLAIMLFFPRRLARPPASRRRGTVRTRRCGATTVRRPRRRTAVVPSSRRRFP